MNNLARRLLAAAAAVILCISLGVPGFAENKYTGVNGGTVNFQKALVMDSQAHVPDVEFTYTISDGTAVAYEAGSKFQVLSPTAAGVTGVPTIGKATYSPGNSVNTIVTSTQTTPVYSEPGNDSSQTKSYTLVTLESGKKAATKTIAIDFSGVIFPEPGVYRYIIEETSSGQQGITYDTQHLSEDGVTTGFTSKKRVLDVYVTDNSGALTVSSYVLHEKVDVLPVNANTYGTLGTPSPVDDKSLGFVNEYETHDIAFEKAVSGNQASKDKYFKFVVAITNAGKNARLNLDFSEAGGALDPTANMATVYDTATMKTANNVDDDTANEGQQLICAADGSVTKTFYLQHGQKLRINGLAKGANVVITETPEDYKSDKAGSKVTINDLQADSLSNVFTNTRNGTVPTGVILTVVPGVLLGGGAIAGLASMLAKKARREEEKD